MKHPCSVRISVLLSVSLFLAWPAGALAQSGDVVINSNTTWTAGNIQINSLTVNTGATLTVGGGSTITAAHGIVVTGNSNIVLESANNAAQVNGTWQGAGVTVSAASIQVDAGSTINADGQGYLASAGPGGAPASSSAGGSYGGLGGVGGLTNVAPAATYGSATAPTDLGSGGGTRCCGAVGGAGGGAILLVVSGTLTNNGIISANGVASVALYPAGGGAGGSVYVTAGTLAGSGSFAANGGMGGEAGGGGGRIAISYTTNSGFNFAQVLANGGSTGNAGAPGTVYLLGASVNLTVSDNLALPPNSNLTFTNITIDNQGSLTLGSGTSLTANAITVSGAGNFNVGGGSTLNVTGAITVTGNSNIVLQATNTTAQVNGSWQGAGVTINAASIQVDAGSSINGDGQGYAVSAGPGGAPAGTSAGGSYGGLGGIGFALANPGPTYGSATAPTDLGSGGGTRCCGVGGAGGGAIRLVVSGTLTNNGIISANGVASYGGPLPGAGGGAGGSVYVATGTLAGSGSFVANGGAGGEASGEAGGGGGRVAVYYGATSNFTGFAASTATGGTAKNPGATGTAGFFDTSAVNYNLNIYQNFPIPAGAAVSYNAVTVKAGGVLTIGGGSVVTVANAFTVTGTVVVQSANTAAQVNGSWQGAGVTIHAVAVQVDATGSITADGQGYAVSAGPGGAPANTSAGGSYGGLGGIGFALANPSDTYGSATAPTDLGSGGGTRCCNAVGGAGGGAVRLLVTGTLTNNGIISANGVAAYGGLGAAAGGGAGGSVYIVANTLAGSGSVAANGGAGGEGAGGGGRIALFYVTNNGFNQNSITAAGGQGNNHVSQTSAAGAAGTVTISSTPLVLWLQPTGTVLHGVETLQWFADFGSAMNVTVSGPQAFTLTVGASTDSSAILDTTTVPDGRYELRLTLLDASGNILQELPRTVAINNTVVWHSGTITSNQEWTATQVQALDGIVIIPSGVTVTVDPGAIVKALPGAEIIVQSGGILNALGGTSLPIIFTTFDDSSAGGNTDFNAGGSLPTPGEWQGVSVLTGGQLNANSNTNFRYVSYTLSGTLSTQTLLGTLVYTVNGTAVVPAGATLTIQPGAILKFNANAGITVQPGAALMAVGTVAQPIYFTSIKDDSIGGDTNGDGAATLPAPGDWGSILIDGAPASFVHVQMFYGGGPVSIAYQPTFGMIQTTDNAVVAISDSVLAQTFWNGIQTGQPNGGGDTVTVTNTVLWGSDERAINAFPGSTVHVVNDTLDGNGAGILAHGGVVDVANTIVSNTKSSQWGGLAVCCGGSFSSISYSDVWTNVAGVPNYGGIADPTGTNGNISVNPVFVNEAQGNYRLNYGSPAIDAANGTVANYPSTDAVGDARYNDPLVTIKTGVPDAGGNYPDMGAFEFVATAPSNIDFTVPSVTGPSTALAGSTVQVNWTVTNIGSGIAYGPWHDAVYLVVDPDTNPVEIFAGQLLEGVGAVLGPGASYNASGTIRVPGTTVGNQRWEVKANVLGEVFEGQNTANNTGISLDPVAVDVPALVVDSPSVSSSFAAAGQSSWYKINPGAGKNVSVNLNLTGGGNTGSVQLFIGQGYVPDSQHFDIQQAEWNSPSASAVISNTSSQTYYVTAYAQSLASSSAPFTLSASSLQFSLSGVQPNSVANIGSVTLTFTGGGFSNTGTYQLAGPGGTVYNSSAVFVSDASQAEVTFAMSGLPTGSYSAKVTVNGITVTLSNALTVTAPSAGTSGNGPIQISLATPQAFRFGFPAEVTLTYKNAGSTDMAAPLMQLTATGGTLTQVPPQCSGCDSNFSMKFQNTFTSSQVLGINHDGPAGVLPAGAEGSITFLATPSSGSNVTFAISSVDPVLQPPSPIEALAVSQGNGFLIGAVFTGAVGVAAGGVAEGAVAEGAVALGSQSIGIFSDASAFCNAFLPPNTNAAGFTRTCMQLLVGAGYQSFSASLLDSFTGGYLYNSGLNNLLAADATALSEMGIYESDVASLMDFEFGKDGLAVFDQRYHQGAFGYGTSHAFDITAQMIGGVPTIFYPDGSTRILNTPSPSQPNQYLGAVGDYGVVSIAADGTWTLTESNGVLFHFKPDPLPTSTKGLILDYIEDLNGNRITLSYTNDLVTSAVDSFGNTITFTYDALGHITQATDPVGRVTTYTYDILGDSQHSTFLTSITNSSGMTSLTWNEGGPHGVGYFDDSCVLSYCEPAIGVKTITYPDGTHTYFTYDALGRLASQYRDGQTETVTYAYTASGAVQATDALGNTTTTAFNQQGGVGQFTDPLAMVTQFSYDPENKLSSVLGPLGTSASLSYDTHGNAAGLRDPLDNQDSLSYAANGNPQSFTDPSGNVVAYGYDSTFDPTSVTYPDGSATQATYDARGNVITSTNRRGHTTTYTYDAHNLRTSKTFAGGAQVHYTYDGHRNLQSVTNSAGTTMYTYDSADRLTGIVYPNGQSIQYSYNAGGQRIGMSDSTGFTVTYSYDSAGRPSQVSNGGARIVAYTYDAAGRLSQKTLGNGTYTTFAYDAAGNLQHLINYSSGGSVISEYDSTYDGMGRRIGMNSPAGAWTYGYDADSQVTSVTLPGGSVQYSYDAAGNRTASIANGSATSFLVNNLDQYTQAGANTYKYDADGNLIAGGGWTYAYDDENRLISTASATDTWSYQYDGLGNRVSATHNGSVTQYLNEPSGFGNVEAEFDGAGHLTGHYTYGLDLAGFVPAAGPAAYYHFDPAGNTAQMTNASGSVVNSYSYLPFGEKLTSIAGVPNPYTYVGELGVMDEGSGLYFMRDRWYDPPLGRFVQLDPIGFTSDSNLYRYAANSPLRFIDPSGTTITAFDVFNHGLNLAGSFIPGGTSYQLAAGVGVGTANVFLGAYSLGNQHNTLGEIHDTAMLITRPLAFFPPEGPLAPFALLGRYSGAIDEGSQGVFRAFWTLWYHPFFPFGPGPTGPNLNLPIVHSHDPNGKLTTGFGDQGYIPPGVAIPYTIYFENQASATAPAQKVVVTDALPSNLDWSTVQLNQIGFNNVTINVTGGLESYTGQVSVSTDPNPVNVSAALNPNTGMLTWTMQSVDPTTGSTPQNPLAGFLPPNTASNQGTGFVTFTVSPKTSLGNGAAITNQANIVFDVNAAIATNTVTNTIDTTAPTSAVNALPAMTASTSFSVSWAGSDPSGSGIAGYNLFFSIDGGAYAVWMPNTTQTSATFTAIAGHTYSFYSLAVNNVGTIQTTPGPSQTTTVLQPSGPGPCTITGDANASVADVQSMINQALGAAKALNDLNHDGTVNVIDVQIVIDAVVGLGCTAQ